MTKTAKFASLCLLALVIAGCQRTYFVTVSARNTGEVSAATVQEALQSFLVTIGFHRVAVPDPWLQQNLPEHVALWRRDDKEQSFWWGVGYVDVEERRKGNAIVVYITQVNGKPGLMQSVTESIEPMLKAKFPDYDVKWNIHTMYGPSWGP